MILAAEVAEAGSESAGWIANSAAALTVGLAAVEQRSARSAGAEEITQSLIADTAAALTVGVAGGVAKR